jgi:cation diffusion facilitator family transporter
MTPSHPAQRASDRLAMATGFVSAVLLAGFVATYVATASLLALGQGADSFVDVLMSVLLVWAARVARQPRDAGHPHGHHAAEPIAALVVAVAAGILATEILTSAVERLLHGEAPVLKSWLLLAFATKGGVKLVIASAAAKVHKQTHSPVAAALFVDSRNDAVVAAGGLVGYFLARNVDVFWDAVLAIPMALWVARSGWVLARENIDLLMGSAAPEDRRGELGGLVASVPGVLSFHDLVVRHHGTHLDVFVHIVLDPTLSLREAHDIGDSVSRMLRSEPDVAHASVHLDVEEDAEA